jgi:hypothetical protein
LNNPNVYAGKYNQLKKSDNTLKFTQYYRQTFGTISTTLNIHSFKIPIKILSSFEKVTGFTATVCFIVNPNYYFENVSPSQFIQDISNNNFYNPSSYISTSSSTNITDINSNFYAGPKIYNLNARTFNDTTLSVDFDLSGSSNPSPPSTYFLAKDVTGQTRDVSGAISLNTYPGVNEIISYYDNRLSGLLPNTTYNIVIYNTYKSSIVSWKITSDSVQQRTAYVGAAPTIVLTPSLNCIVVDFSQNPQGYPTPKYSYSIDNGVNYNRIADGVFNFPHSVTSINPVSVIIKSDNSGGTISSSSVTSDPAFISSTLYITNITPGLNSLFVNFFTDTNNCNPSSGIKYYYQGGEEWDKTIPTIGKEAEQGCVGCGWYDFEAWRNALNQKLIEFVQNQEK